MDLSLMAVNLLLFHQSSRVSMSSNEICAMINSNVTLDLVAPKTGNPIFSEYSNRLLCPFSPYRPRKYINPNNAIMSISSTIFTYGYLSLLAAYSGEIEIVLFIL